MYVPKKKKKFYLIELSTRKNDIEIKILMLLQTIVSKNKTKNARISLREFF